MKSKAIETVSKLTKSGRIPRIIYNDDSVTLRTAEPPHSLESLGYALDYLKGTQVDCLCWCIGEQVAYAWPSKVMENIFDMYDKGNRKMIGYMSTERDVMYSLHRQGIDYLHHLIERAHNQGLMFVASFRMNDTHVKSYPNSFLTPDFWKEHQDWRIWDATDAKGYYNAALDYAVPQVRNRYRDAILEVAQNYDVDGVELDFSRTPYLFQPSEAWEKRGILTKFVRQLRDRLKTIGKRRKKPFALVLRIPSRQRVLRTAGIDAEQWIKQGLPTILVITELVINLNQRLEHWQSLCSKAGVLLYPSVEASGAYNRVEFYSTLVQSPTYPRHDGWALATTQDDQLLMQRAAAMNFLAQKPDGIYMFNFPCRLAEGRNVMHTDRTVFDNVVSVLHQMGSPRTLARKPRYYTFFQDLPIYVEANRPRRFHQTIEFDIRGNDLKDATVKLRFRQIAEKNPHADGDFDQSTIVPRGVIVYYLNDREVPEDQFKRTHEPAGRVASGFTLGSHEQLELQLPGSRLRNGINTLAFEMPKYPHEQDSYVYIYDLEAELTF